MTARYCGEAGCSRATVSHLWDPETCPTPEALPESFDVTGLAAWVAATAVPGTPWHGEHAGALTAWRILTGAPDRETALAWADAVVTAPGSLTAICPPF